MKYRKIFSAIVVLSAILCHFPSKTVTAESVAARCRILSFDEAYNSSEAVFVGKVLSEKKEGDVRTFEFEVSEYWKGANKKKIKINVYETPRYQAWFEVGEVYLIYAMSNDGGKLSVGRCSRSRGYDEAGEDLQKLGASKKPE